ncbi:MULTISPECIES: hypothetical protein [unclassified Microbacterium]|uniref:hypothetical protein n=1 Tax=unclassified Microbacterium TaxID=2609290 RepID=UPI00214B155D|nr:MULTISPECIES: hypothetical protein [unclassified Microbacterium]MCR2810084.1 hypothetical protein [Microbacterium sp. zg.B185]WIM20078.1 hypothetical protein QNO12_04525 [Microbacterium sp. zg-B185]
MSPASSRRSAPARAAAGVAAAIALCLGLAGCQPEPSPTASRSPSTTPSATAAPTPTPTETAAAGDSIELPTACEQLYSPGMLAALQEQAPLNDPGVTMTSTQVVGALEILSSGIPTIRCSWGLPSETGLATNVSLVDAAQSTALLDAFANSGFACEPSGEGTICRYTQTVIDLDDNQVELTETHVLRGNGWVSTATINFAPEGYTEDIVATLWG